MAGFLPGRAPSMASTAPAAPCMHCPRPAAVGAVCMLCMHQTRQNTSTCPLRSASKSCCSGGEHACLSPETRSNVWLCRAALLAGGELQATAGTWHFGGCAPLSALHVLRSAACTRFGEVSGALSLFSEVIKLARNLLFGATTQRESVQLWLGALLA